MALKSIIAAGFVAVTMALLPGTAAEAKTKIVIGIGTGGYGGWASPCWRNGRRCYVAPRPGYFYYPPNRRPVIYYGGPVVYYGGGRGHALSCSSARRVVDRSGFNAVKTNECRGDVYTFNARKNGKAYRVRVNARTGHIIGSGRI